MTIAGPSQTQSRTLARRQSRFPSSISKEKVLSAGAFAKLALFNDPSGLGELKPIRRPLPAHAPLLSDSDDSLSDSEPEAPPSTFIKKRAKSKDPFCNPDESDSDMSPGLSPSPSPKLSQISGSTTQLNTEIQNLYPTNSILRANSNDQTPESSTMPLPFRRGLVTPTTDFDALLTFKDETPALPPNGGEKKRKRRSAELEQKAIREEPREVSMACHDTVHTPEMSWALRGRKLVAGKGGKVGRSSGMGNGEGGSAGGENGIGGGVGGKGKSVNKRTARRVGGVPKRQYVWKDTKVKNKAHFQRKGKAGGKGKEKEIVREG